MVFKYIKNRLIITSQCYVQKILIIKNAFTLHCKSDSVILCQEKKTARHFN